MHRTPDVYWTDAGLQAVMKAPIGGGAPVTLASTQQSNPGGLALDVTSAYWGASTPDGKGGVIMKVPVTGDQAVTIAAGGSLPLDIGLDATSVYWSTLDGSQILEAPI